MNGWVFAGVTIGLALFEWLLSHSIASSELIGKKGLVSDVLAALVMVMLGLAFERAGNAGQLQCDVPEGLLESLSMLKSSVEGCREHAEEITTLGKMIRTTLGMNSVIAALVLYAVFEVARRLFLYWIARSARAR